MAPTSIDYVALHYAMAALGGAGGGGGGDDKHASQWYVSLDPVGTPYPGSQNGDLILYENGDIYKVIDGIPVDQHVNIGKKDCMNPYEYAVSIGFQGTKDEFDMRFLGALQSGSTNTIVSGGVPGSKPNVIISGGVPGSKQDDLHLDGSTVHTKSKENVTKTQKASTKSGNKTTSNKSSKKG